MPDIKKLITGFLIIATAASASAIVLSSTINQNGIGGAAVATGTLPGLADQNAFIPTQADITNAVAADNPDVAKALNDPKNLTTNYTEAFLNSISASNPNGLNTDDSGNLSIKNPDAAVLAAQLKSNPNFKKIVIPSWDAEAAAANRKVKITDQVSASAYNDSLNAIFNKNLVQTGVESLVGQQDLDASNFAAVVPPLGDAANDAVQTQVPSSLAGFHQSLVKMLVYEKNMATLGVNAQDDPVKAALIYQAQQQKYTLTLQDFGTQLEKASAKGLVSFKVPAGTTPRNAALAFLADHLGIPTTHAQWIVNDPVNLGEWIMSFVNQIVLQVLKNTLSAFLQQRVLKWIQGSGAPLFVQQFGQQLVQVGQAKAMASVAQILPGYNYTCPNIGNLLGPTIANLGLTVPVGKQPPQCSIPAASVGQLGNFYKNFNINANAVPGGVWGMYGQILNPAGNYYGAVFQSQDYIDSQSGAAQQTVQTKQIANQGFKAQTACPGGADPNGTSQVCSDGKTTPGYQWVCADHTTPLPQDYCDGSPMIPGTVCSGLKVTKYICLGGAQATHELGCPDGKPATTQSNEGFCPPDTPGGDWTEAKETTPGGAAMQALGHALGSEGDIVANANSVVGVLASVGASFLNTLVAVGVNSATNGLTSIVLDESGLNAGKNSGLAATTPPSSGNPPVTLPKTQCFPKNPECTQGPGGQCTSGFFGDRFTFTATGGDALNFSWNVGGANCIVPNYDNTHGPTFTPYFVQSTSTECLAAILPPTVTIPITVTGADNVSDTCLAVIATGQ